MHDTDTAPAPWPELRLRALDGLAACIDGAADRFPARAAIAVEAEPDDNIGALDLILSGLVGFFPPKMVLWIAADLADDMASARWVLAIAAPDDRAIDRVRAVLSALEGVDDIGFEGAAEDEHGIDEAD